MAVRAVRTPTISLCLVVGLLGACSSSHASRSARSSPPSSVVSGATPALSSPTIECAAAFDALFAQAAGTKNVTFESQVTSGYTRCDYKAVATTGAGCSAATVSVDTAPQAFKDFNRWVVETTQNAGGGPPGHAPEQINRIGVLADWVPATQLFETGTEDHWITVQLSCKSSDAQALQLAEALAKAALSTE